jgi:hypothetical protein
MAVRNERGLQRAKSVSRKEDTGRWEEEALPTRPFSIR